MTQNKNKSKPAKISRSEFIVKGGVLAGSTVLLPTLVLGQKCDLTTDDIYGSLFCSRCANTDGNCPSG